MKSTIIVLMSLLASTANAQLKPESRLDKPIPSKVNVYTKPAAPPPPSQTTLTDAEYFLAGAVIKISTGGDNKEANTSTAFFQVRPRKSNGVVAYKLENYANELPSNQTADLRLDRAAALTSAQNSLQYFKQNGLSVVVAYANKSFCTDAWKINSVTVTLEFKDAQGNPAPAGYSSKTISFPVSSGTLGFVAGCNPFWVTNPNNYIGYSDQKLKMLLKTDEYFNPLPALLMGWFADDIN